MTDWEAEAAAHRVAEQRRRLQLGAALLELARGCAHPGGLIARDARGKIAEVRTDDVGGPVALLVAL